MNATRLLLALAVALTLPACASTRGRNLPETTEIPATDPGANANAQPLGSDGATTTVATTDPVAQPVTDRGATSCDPLPVVYFAYDRSDLTVDAAEAVVHLGTCLRERGVSTATIEAFADERGSSDYNVALSQRRGDEVRQTLERAEVPVRVTVVPWGAAFPASPGTGEEHWKLNRRAVVKLPGDLLVDGRHRAK
jgi:peptidoglycan-associated lipoprotein